METPTERLLETQMNLTVEMFSSVCEALVFMNVTPQGYYFSFNLHLGLVCVYFVAHFYGPSVSVF